jgi:hypothetical protein
MFMEDLWSHENANRRVGYRGYYLLLRFYEEEEGGLDMLYMRTMSRDMRWAFLFDIWNRHPGAFARYVFFDTPD